MFMKHLSSLFLSLCTRENKKTKLSFYEMTFCVATVFTTGGNVLLCCRDAVNIKGGLEHLVSSI